MGVPTGRAINVRPSLLKPLFFFFNLRQQFQAKQIPKEFFTQILLGCEGFLLRSTGYVMITRLCIGLFAPYPVKGTVPAMDAEDFSCIHRIMLTIILTAFTLILFQCYHLSIYYRVYNSKSQ